MQFDVYNIEGKVVGQVELNEGVFGVAPNEHALHMAVVTYLANQRQGNAKTKVRGEVSGGGKKPWKQKGRGTARSGSSRSPVWVGGGTIHGPKVFDHRLKLPKKISRLGRKSAFSLRASEKNLIVLEDFDMNEIKTKKVAEVLTNLNITGSSTLILTNEVNNNVYMSSRNIPKVDVNVAEQASTYEILSHKKIVIFKSAITTIESALLS